MNNYHEAWESWRADPESYWAKNAENVHWFKKWDKVVDTSDQRCIKWFVGGRLNMCYNCIDKNVEDGFGDKTILIYESFFTKEVRKLTYSDLLDQVSRFAGVLHDCGVTQDSVVLINLPMVPEAIISVLASARLGAPYVVMSHGYTYLSLKERIEELQPKVIISTNCSFLGAEFLEMKTILDKALENSSFVPEKCIILQRSCGKPAEMQPSRDISWIDAMDNAKPHDCVSLEANHPLFIIYTSGSTGKPKGLIHTVAGLPLGIFKDNIAITNYNDGHVCWSMSQLAWIVGQIGACYSPLLGKTATIIYEGPMRDPDVDDMHRILSTYDITNAFIPTDAFRSLRRRDPSGEAAAKYGPFKLKHIVSGGSPMDLSTLEYAQQVYKATVVQVYAQSEMGCCMTIDASDPSWRKHWPPLSSGKRCPGWDMRILRDDNTEADEGEIGNIAIKLPLGPGITSGIFKNENMFLESYLSRFPGYYDTKDLGKFDSEGHLYVTGRSDSVFKISGSRYSLDAIEKIILSHPSIAQCAVVLQVTQHETTQQKLLIPFGFYITRSDVGQSEKLSEEIKTTVINQLGVDLSIIRIFAVKALPHLVTGKPNRAAIKAIVDKWPSVQEPSQSEDQGIRCIYAALEEKLPN